MTPSLGTGGSRVQGSKFKVNGAKNIRAVQNVQDVQPLRSVQIVKMSVRVPVVPEVPSLRFVPVAWND
jgi:hypothetical protein